MTAITNGRELLSQFLDEITLMTDMDNNANVDQVNLMTIHSSKGLEFPTVFIGGLEDNNFPGNNAHFEPDEMEEERRLMYVAITRAKDYLFLSHANQRQIWGKTQMGKPSRFIGEIPEEFIKSYNLGGGNVTKPVGKSSFTGIGYATTPKAEPKFAIGDRVAAKIFGSGEIVDIRGEMAVVKMDKGGLKKLDVRFLEMS